MNHKSSLFAKSIEYWDEHIEFLLAKDSHIIEPPILIQKGNLLHSV